MLHPNEVHEVPLTGIGTIHSIEGDSCICRPDAYTRWQNGNVIGVVVRHKNYTPAEAASTRFVRGY